MPEYYLGIETSGSATAVALIDGSRTVFETTEPGTNHNEVLLKLVDRALRAGGLKAQELRGICVTIGPGMFSALRVGLSVAKGLALPCSTPVKGIDTLLALALSVDRPEAPVLALIDAKKQQVYCGIYFGDRPLLTPAVLRPEELPAALKGIVSQGLTLTLCGNGARLCAQALAQAAFPVVFSGVELPAARVVAQLGRKLILAQGGDDIENLAPKYLRRTDAELRRNPFPPGTLPWTIGGGV